MNAIMDALLMLPALVVGLTAHEFAHALAAHWLGDDFPRRQGRLSLNPLRHLSLLGTLALFIVHFGWAKPVVVNPYNFRHPRRDMLLTSLAGPAANLLLAGACLAAMQFTRHTFIFGVQHEAGMLLAHALLSMSIVLNVILAVLNLLPIPPLDGSRIWPVLLPQVRGVLAAKGTMIGTIALVTLLWTGRLDPLFHSAVQATRSIMPQTDQEVFMATVAEAYKAEDAEDWPAAEARYTNALSICPGSAICLRRRAATRGWQDKWDLSLTDLDAALAAEPGNANDYEYRATVLGNLGRDDEAAEAIRAADNLRAQEKAATQESDETSAPKAAAPGSNQD